MAFTFDTYIPMSISELVSDVIALKIDWFVWNFFLIFFFCFHWKQMLSDWHLIVRTNFLIEKRNRIFLVSLVNYEMMKWRWPMAAMQPTAHTHTHTTWIYCVVSIKRMKNQRQQPSNRNDPFNTHKHTNETMNELITCLYHHRQSNMFGAARIFHISACALVFISNCWSDSMDSRIPEWWWWTELNLDLDNWPEYRWMTPDSISNGWWMMDDGGYWIFNLIWLDMHICGILDDKYLPSIWFEMTGNQTAHSRWCWWSFDLSHRRNAT